MGAWNAKLLLPAVSTLAFLPAASVAVRRRFCMEAMVYFFTMCFTALDHLLGPCAYLPFLCHISDFMNPDMSGFFSVYGTALSMWVTLIALGDFDEPTRSSVTMFGVLNLAVAIYRDREGYEIYAGTIGSAVFFITVTWLLKMVKIRAVYPEKSVYTKQVGPGCCVGALALMLRFYFEGWWDPAYVLCFFHLLLAVSLVVLLPKRNPNAGLEGNCCCCCCCCCCC